MNKQEAPAPAILVAPCNRRGRGPISLLALLLLSCGMARSAGQDDSNAKAAPAGQEQPEYVSNEAASQDGTGPIGDEDEEVGGRLYVTQSERREAGLKHPITPWLTASFLLELEGLVEDFALEDGLGDERFTESGANLQLGLEAAPLDFAKAELVLEYDTQTGKLFTEEAFLSFEVGPWELEAGKLYTPFGVYISHFAIGPILELGDADPEDVGYDAPLSRSPSGRGTAWTSNSTPIAAAHASRAGMNGTGTGLHRWRSGRVRGCSWA